MSTAIKRELEKAPEIPIIKRKWRPNILWKLFILAIYGGIKIPMANEQDSSTKPPIVQWPVFIFLAGIVMLGFSYFRDSSKDTAMNAATQATILEKLNSMDASIRSNNEFTKSKMEDMNKRLDKVESVQGDIETLVGLRPTITRERQQQQLDESRGNK